MEIFRTKFIIPKENFMIKHYKDGNTNYYIDNCYNFYNVNYQNDLTIRIIDLILNEEQIKIIKNYEIKCYKDFKIIENKILEKISFINIPRLHLYGYQDYNEIYEFLNNIQFKILKIIKAKTTTTYPNLPTINFRGLNMIDLQIIGKNGINNLKLFEQYSEFDFLIFIDDKKNILIIHSNLTNHINLNGINYKKDEKIDYKDKLLSYEVIKKIRNDSFDYNQLYTSGYDNYINYINDKIDKYINEDNIDKLMKENIELYEELKNIKDNLKKLKETW